MAKTESNMLPLGTQAPSFSLPSTDGSTVSLEETVGANGLLVMFLCVHCPYVIHVQNEVGRIASEYGKKGVGMVAISANDTDKYPQDGAQFMAKQKAECGFDFPYLYDESQEVAKAYQAACTPDFFLFDNELKLVYRGQLDASRPGNAMPNDGADLREALDAVVAGRDVSDAQMPSLGCNIKWKPGNEPAYS